MRVVSIQEKHYNQLALLGKEALTESRYASKEYSHDRAVAFIKWSHTADDYDTTAFVAEADDGEVIGVLAIEAIPYFFCKGRRAVETFFYVKPSWRMSKAMLELVSHAERWAKAVNADSMMLGVSGALDYKKVESAYNKLGYETVGCFTVKEFTP